MSKEDEFSFLSEEGLKCLKDKFDIDYCSGIMGVPITFMNKYCKSQFKIIGPAMGWSQSQMPEEWKKEVSYNSAIYSKSGTRSYGIINGIQKYHRILIKRKFQ